MTPRLATLPRREFARASGVGPSLEWHLITPEYPPAAGGVSDYTATVAAGLAEAGDDVHVWCPALPGPTKRLRGVTVHADQNGFAAGDLRRMGRALDRFARPRRILVQWVPHGYGYRSMNLPLCMWLLWRSRWSGDHVELMVHEPFLAFGEGSWRQDMAAVVHRMMAMILLQAAERVWVSIPAWQERLRAFALGRRSLFRWLPVPSNIAVADDAYKVREIRRRCAARGEVLIGHFGTYGPPIVEVLEPVLASMGKEADGRAVLLIGIGSEAFRENVVRRWPEAAGWLHATGALAPQELSSHIAACDLLIQPYPDGVSSRRGTFMAALSHGKPVVATVGHLTEPFWIHSGAAALGPVGDVQRFVELVWQVCGDAGLRLRMGDVARRLYRERFDAAHTIGALRGQHVESTESHAHLNRHLAP